MSLESQWLIEDLHNLRWRYIHAVNNDRPFVLLLDDPIRRKLGLISDDTCNKPPPGTPACYKRVICVKLHNLQKYIDQYSLLYPLPMETSNANR